MGAVINRTKDGKLIEVESSANPILDGSGKIVGFLAVQRDITERRHAEESLLKMVRTDGTSIWTTTRGEVMREVGGQPVGFRGTVLDINERTDLKLRPRVADELVQWRLNHIRRSLMSMARRPRC